MSKAPVEIRSLARSHTAKALRVLSEIMDDPEINAAARVAAATALLDRGWGKPTVHVEAEVSQRQIVRIPEKSTTADIWQRQHSPEATLQ